jgi:hypothetical protein
MPGMQINSGFQFIATELINNRALRFGARTKIAKFISLIVLTLKLWRVVDLDDSVSFDLNQTGWKMQKTVDDALSWVNFHVLNVYCPNEILKCCKRGLMLTQVHEWKLGLLRL